MERKMFGHRVKKRSHERARDLTTEEIQKYNTSKICKKRKTSSDIEHKVVV